MRWDFKTKIKYFWFHIYSIIYYNRSAKIYEIHSRLLNRFTDIYRKLNYEKQGIKIEKKGQKQEIIIYAVMRWNF